MRCLKCDSVSVFDRDDEAPIGVRAWMKCMSCGKRWEPTTAAPVESDAVKTIRQAFDEFERDDEAELAARRDIESPTKLAMKDVRVQR